eukprot:3898194-Pyramimonas_sp.AAC.1
MPRAVFVGLLERLAHSSMPRGGRRAPRERGQSLCRAIPRLVRLKPLGDLDVDHPGGDRHVEGEAPRGRARGREE